MAPSTLAAPRLPRAFLNGVRRFNAGEFFEAHEAFEELLDDVEGDARWELLVALIQVAVGYHKCASGHAGDRTMLEKGLARLQPFADGAGGVALNALRARIRTDIAALGAGTPASVVLADPPRLTLAAKAGWSR